MKTIKIEATVKINAGKDEGSVMKVIFEIPYSESVFKESSPSFEENLAWLDEAKKVLKNKGMNVNQEQVQNDRWVNFASIPHTPSLETIHAPIGFSGVHFLLNNLQSLGSLRPRRMAPQMQPVLEF